MAQHVLDHTRMRESVSSTQRERLCTGTDAVSSMAFWLLAVAATGTPRKVSVLVPCR